MTGNKTPSVQLRCVAILVTFFGWTRNNEAGAFLPSQRKLGHPFPSACFSSMTVSVVENPQDTDAFAIDYLLIQTLQSHDSFSLLELGGIKTASSGIKKWRSALTKGRIPLKNEFEQCDVWPPEPLFSQLEEAMVLMELPRFTFRHPEATPSILRSVLQLTMKFLHELQHREDEDEIVIEAENDFVDEFFEAYMDEEMDFMDSLENSLDEGLSESDIAREVVATLVEEWSGVVNGVGVLDQIFGFDHGLFAVHDDESEGGPTAGFGLQDGVWKHTGWKAIPQLQKQISAMPELKLLVQDLGRSPTVKNSDSRHKFAPRKRHRDGSLGAEFDPHSRESVSGITLSGNIVDMLPSEAILLRGGSPVLRRLFLAKKAESKLLSYELSGWTDVKSIPKPRPRYLNRMPSAPGGPIIVCLDTSWSMSGMREQLSKAVVLACVSAAYKQGRECRVVSFSTELGVMESGTITGNSAGIQRLLDFLGHSFGGGTDVTGALKVAINTLESEGLSDADLLMVSDGEIPDPPVSKELMDVLEHLKLWKEVKVHGLLVGKTESKAFSKLCSTVHTFLLGYETFATIGKGVVTSTSALSCNLARPSATPDSRRVGFGRSPLRKRFGFALKAKKSMYDGAEEREWKKPGGKQKGKRQYGGYDEEFAVTERANGLDDRSEGFELDENPRNEEDPFLQEVDNARNRLETAVKNTLQESVWNPTNLKDEIDGATFTLDHQNDLKTAIEITGRGLVQRSEEARLVLLAMIAEEHILLLGVPGTGKSVLGRRLSKLCKGAFFQRLLTRFTTPEELFGPLSLRSLENDEYRRVTKGFLPTASVAFLDEIFKANSAILNTLLTILNERKFDNAGGQEDCPIRCVMGASNELPESDELVALFDRFLIRKEVSPVSDEGVVEMLSMANGVQATNDESMAVESLDSLISELLGAIESVHLPVDVCELIRDVRTFMRDELNSDISDRRLVKAARLLKISAASHGRNRVDPIDCMLLQHCIWQLPEQRKQVREWLWDNLTPGSGQRGSPGQYRFLLDGLRQEFLATLQKTSGDLSGAHGARPEDVAKIRSLRTELDVLLSILYDRQADLARHVAIIGDSTDYLWLDPDDAKSIKQLLQPRATAVSAVVEEALRDALSLREATSDDPGAPSNETRVYVIRQLWEDGAGQTVNFTEQELDMGMKEAKAKYDLETFRKWKRAKKKASN